MIDVKNLEKTFGDHKVLAGINEHIYPGEKVVVIGPSGSGAAEDLPGNHGTACQGVFRIHPDLFPQ